MLAKINSRELTILYGFLVVLLFVYSCLILINKRYFLHWYLLFVLVASFVLILFHNYIHPDVPNIA